MADDGLLGERRESVSSRPDGEWRSKLDAVLRRAAREGMASTVRAGATDYDRARCLPRLIRAEPRDILDETAAGRQKIVVALVRALAAERRAGRARRWTYDINRHIALVQALASETARSQCNAQARRDAQTTANL